MPFKMKPKAPLVRKTSPFAEKSAAFAAPDPKKKAPKSKLTRKMKCK